MGKIMVAGRLQDFDEFEREMRELEEANEADRREKPSPLSPQGSAEIWDRYNKRGKFAEKKKPLRK